MIILYCHIFITLLHSLFDAFPLLHFPLTVSQLHFLFFYSIFRTSFFLITTLLRLFLLLIFQALLFHGLIHISLLLSLLQTVGAAGNVSQDFITSGSGYKLTGLTPKTQYEVKVVVRVVEAGGERNLTCLADGTGRERVHSVTFTTTCPEGVSLEKKYLIGDIS